MPTTVGWSDLALFAFFDKRQVSANQVYFYFLGAQFQKIGKIGCARTRRMRSKGFIFKKTQGP